MKRIVLFWAILLCALSAQANNVAVTNVTLTGQNSGANTSIIQFDLSWENSWRLSSGPANYDAAWVFAKYRVGGGAWQHAILSGTGAAPDGGTVDNYDNRGAMIYRSADGGGDVSFNNIQLIWDYGATGVDDNDVVDVQVFAIEMVYVPEAPFSLGTGRAFAATTETQESNEFYTSFNTGPPFFFTTQNAYLVTSEALINISNANGDLFYFDDESNAGDQTGTLSANFPKGFAAFYCMKYEVSESQWVAFFNTLTDAQKEARDITGPSGKNSDSVFSRNTVAWPGSGNAQTSAPDIAVSFVSVGDAMAYLDWAALRPMTELEYEKTGRGTAAPLNQEYAWGTTNIYEVDYDLSNLNQANERIDNAGVQTGNANFGDTDANIRGPLRCGIFAASAVNASREETGGSFYGIMELSGNLYERAVTVGSVQGREFTGVHGDGAVASNGQANVINWPDNETGAGIGYRGGAHVVPKNRVQLSDRFDGATVIAGGNSRLGFRGVRTAQ